MADKNVTIGLKLQADMNDAAKEVDAFGAKLSTVGLDKSKLDQAIKLLDEFSKKLRSGSIASRDITAFNLDLKSIFSKSDLQKIEAVAKGELQSVMKSVSNLSSKVKPDLSQAKADLLASLDELERIAKERGGKNQATILAATSQMRGAAGQNNISVDSIQNLGLGAKKAIDEMMKSTRDMEKNAESATKALRNTMVSTVELQRAMGNDLKINISGLTQLDEFSARLSAISEMKGVVQSLNTLSSAYDAFSNALPVEQAERFRKKLDEIKTIQSGGVNEKSAQELKNKLEELVEVVNSFSSSVQEGFAGGISELATHAEGLQDAFRNADTASQAFAGHMNTALRILNGDLSLVQDGLMQVAAKTGIVKKAMSAIASVGPATFTLWTAAIAAVVAGLKMLFDALANIEVRMRKIRLDNLASSVSSIKDSENDRAKILQQELSTMDNQRKALQDQLNSERQLLEIEEEIAEAREKSSAASEVNKSRIEETYSRRQETRKSENEIEDLNADITRQMEELEKRTDDLETLKEEQNDKIQVSARAQKEWKKNDDAVKNMGSVYAKDISVGAAAGAAVGAGIGSFVPIIGTAIGAAVGGIVGGIGGALKANSDISAAQETLQESINVMRDAMKSVTEGQEEINKSEIEIAALQTKIAELEKKRVAINKRQQAFVNTTVSANNGVLNDMNASEKYAREEWTYGERYSGAYRDEQYAMLNERRKEMQRRADVYEKGGVNEKGEKVVGFQEMKEKQDNLIAEREKHQMELQKTGLSEEQIAEARAKSAVGKSLDYYEQVAVDASNKIDDLNNQILAATSGFKETVSAYKENAEKVRQLDSQINSAIVAYREEARQRAIQRESRGEKLAEDKWQREYNRSTESGKLEMLRNDRAEGERMLNSTYTTKDSKGNDITFEGGVNAALQREDELIAIEEKKRSNQKLTAEEERILATRKHLTEEELRVATKDKQRAEMWIDRANQEMDVIRLQKQAAEEQRKHEYDREVDDIIYNDAYGRASYQGKASMDIGRATENSKAYEEAQKRLDEDASGKKVYKDIVDKSGNVVKSAADQRREDERTRDEARQKTVQSAQNLLSAANEGDQKGVEFRNRFAGSNRLVAMGLAGGGEFKWGSQTAKNTDELRKLARSILDQMRGNKGQQNSNSPFAKFGY